MSYTEPDDNDQGQQDDGTNDNTVHLKRSQIKVLEDKAKKYEEAESRAQAAERKLAFASAGIDLNDPRMSYFDKGYEGDLTPEAIRQEATQAGFLAPVADIAQSIIDAQQSIQAASLGGVESNPDGIPLEDAMAAAKTPEELEAVMRQSGLPFFIDQ